MPIQDGPKCLRDEARDLIYVHLRSESYLMQERLISFAILV